MHKPNNFLEFDVKDELDWAPMLDADRFVPQGSVTADANDGRVTLSGQVRHHFQRTNQGES